MLRDIIPLIGTGCTSRWGLLSLTSITLVPFFIPASVYFAICIIDEDGKRYAYREYCSREYLASPLHEFAF